MPFALKVTKVPCDGAPLYMGGVKGMDFPFCGVKIENEYWILLGNAGRGPSRWMGTNFVSATQQPDGRNENRKHVDRPYMLGGMWYDTEGKKLYAPMHCETHLAITGVAGGDRQIHLSSSTDKGKSWKYEGPLLTRTGNDNPWRPVSAFSGAWWNGGDGDFYVFVDERGGYIYIYSNHYTWPKWFTPKEKVRATPLLRHNVARCAIADKMAPGKWKRFYNGKWEEPGVGGKASFVNGYCVMYNTYLKKYISFNYGSGISLCTDMDKQDWTPSFEIQPKESWGTSWDLKTQWIGFGWGAWHVMNADRTDIYTGGQTLYWYKYWMDREVECYRLDLGAGETATTGYHAQGGYGYAPTVYSPPFMLYGDCPFYDSPDPIESRRTRKVEFSSPEVTASPGWKQDGVSGVTNSSLELTFKGRDIYWRTARGPARGKADVFLDGVLQATVDTWASFDTKDLFAFVKTGLDPIKPHTIKVVVRGEKNARSTGTAIAHLCFEYSADSHSAFNGFSSVQGQNLWRYQERQGEKVADMTFQKGVWRGEGGAEVSFDSLSPGQGEAQAVRVWTAPHDGQVRVEGRVTAREGLAATIAHNDRPIWPAPSAAAEKPAPHDLTVAVKQGDTISFAAHRRGVPPVAVAPDTKESAVMWEPVITYVP
ncbi:MAG: hypothetical protein FJ224_11060 [Lentisphaerae bacterium]|nr:hypothetical protein [Lentisphaerota bacterium]